MSFKDELIEKLNEKYKQNVHVGRNIDQAMTLIENYLKELEQELADVVKYSNGQVRFSYQQNHMSLTVNKHQVLFRKSQTEIEVRISGPDYDEWVDTIKVTQSGYCVGSGGITLDNAQIGYYLTKYLMV